MRLDLEKSLQTVYWEDTITCRVLADIQQAVFKTLLSEQDTNALMRAVSKKTGEKFLDVMSMGGCNKVVGEVLWREVKGVFWHRGDKRRLTIYHD